MNPDGYTTATATVTVPAGAYTLDGLTIPTGWRVQHPLIVESAD